MTDAELLQHAYDLLSDWLDELGLNESQEDELLRHFLGKKAGLQ